METELIISIIAVVIAAISAFITIYFQWFYMSEKVRVYLLQVSFEKTDEVFISSDQAIKGVILTLAFVNSGNVDITVSRSALHFEKELSTPALKEFDKSKMAPLFIRPKSTEIAKLRFNLASAVSSARVSTLPLLVSMALSFQTLGPSKGKKEHKINFGNIQVVKGSFAGISHNADLESGIRIR